MYLSHLSLANYRNFRHLELSLPPGMVVLVGANAQGKTSLLEAIYSLAISRSFRAENERDVVSWDSAAEMSHAMVGGMIKRQDDKLRVTIGYQCIPTTRDIGGTAPGHPAAFSVRKQVTVNRARRTALELVGQVNAALFSADDMALVLGSPSGRRRYLDILLSQMDLGYLRALQGYQRVLQQRNQLLRLLQDRRAEEAELTFWDEELVKAGSQVLLGRVMALRPLRVLADQCHRTLAGNQEGLALEYLPTVPLHFWTDEGPSDTSQVHQELTSQFHDLLVQSRRRECALGSTVVGPHRDDFRMLVAGVDMGRYASRGQARTVALTLRLAEASLLWEQRGEGPIVLLDDVLSELDSQRRTHVLEQVQQYQQVIITTTDLDLLGPDIAQRATCFKVQDSQVLPWA